MDLGRAFGYVFDDESWLNKILIGGLLQIIPIVGQIALIGYMLEVARNVARGEPHPLPDWSAFGDKFMRGLYGLVIQLAYASPVILLGVVMGCLAGLVGASTGTEEEAGAAITGIMLCMYPLIFLGALVVQPFMLAGLMRYAETDNLGTALQFGEVIRIVRSNLGAWVVLWLVYLLCQLVASLGSIACGIGVLFSTVYSQAVFGHALGQMMPQTGTGPTSTDYPDYPSSPGTGPTSTDYPDYPSSPETGPSSTDYPDYPSSPGADPRV